MAETVLAAPVPVPTPGMADTSSSFSLLSSPPPPPPASTSAVVGTPPDPNTIPIHPPHGTPPPPPGQLLPEVEMAEAAPVASVNGTTNGYHNGLNGALHDLHSPTETAMNVDGDDDNGPADDVPPSEGASSIAPAGDDEHMAEAASLSPAPPPITSSLDAPVYGLVNGNISSGSIRPHPDTADEDTEPPAKRARTDTTDVASLTHTNGTTVVSPSASPAEDRKPFAASPDSPAATTLSAPQWRFMSSTIRQLKKLRDAAPFLFPVDPVALNIPHYPSIISHPMDLGTVEKKVASSNPLKPDVSSAHGRYRNADDFTADVRLIFANALAFNGPEHAVTLMGSRVEDVFNKQIKNIPPNEDFSPKKEASLPPTPVPIPPKKPRKSSTAVPVAAPAAPAPAPAPPPAPARLSDPNLAINQRPKREVHPPPPRDLGYTDPPKRTRIKKGKDDGTAEQLKFCSKVLSDIFKKQYWTFTSPFYEPVDWEKLNLPSYPKVIKKPMDLSTMKKKLDRGEYSDALKFYADFKLMIRNCFTFNPAGTPVNNAGHQLSDLFEEKWKALPPLRDVPPSEPEDFEEEEDEDSGEDEDASITALTQQLESVKSNIAALQKKKAKRKEEKRKAKVATQASNGPRASGSRAYNGAAPKKKGKARTADADEVLSFEQKRELSEAIGLLEGAKLERVIQIIHEGVPEIRDSQDEIELDIDTLPAHVLSKLYHTVMRPIKPKPGGRANVSRTGSGTGGLKRKSMDEEAEAERIRLLEERIRLFDKDPHASGAAANGGGDESSDSDSSGSGSDSD